MTGRNPMTIADLSRLTDREWTRIQAVLPLQKTGRPRKNDREHIGELLYALATNRALYDPGNLNHASLLGVKRRRWEADGTWPKILAAGAPGTRRMRKRWLACVSGRTMARLLAQFETRQENRRRAAGC
jgi:transposase